MSILASFVLGFTFSFGWTPCIGPILASVLVMASTSDSIFTANLLILVYTVGFILPFIIVSLFYSKLYDKFDNVKKYMNVIKRIGGIFIIIAGLIMLVNGVKNISNEVTIKNENKIENIQDKNDIDEENNIYPIDFTLYDQYANKHTLSDYKGKTVFLNFWATWCPPCREEMPYINELYEEYNNNQDDVVILGVAFPNMGREGTEEDIKVFLVNNNYKFPVVFDDGGNMVIEYGINAFPSTFIINKDGYIDKYIPGTMDKKTMKKLIDDIN